MNRELELFKKFYPVLAQKEKGSEESETIADTAIISQKEADAYADPNQICLEV